MPSSTCRPSGDCCHRSSRSSPRKSCALDGREHADLVDPAAEVRRDADVRRGRDDALADAGDVGQAGQDPAERLLRRHAARPSGRRWRRDREHAVAAAPGTLFSSPPVAAHALPCRRRRVEAVPLVVRRQPDRRRSSSICSRRQQRRVVERVAGDRQAPALDGVGEHDARPVGDGVAGAVAVEQDVEVVAAEVLHERRHLVVGVRRRATRVTSASAPARKRVAAARRPGGRTATGTPRSTSRRCAPAAPRRRAGRTPPAAAARTWPRRRASRRRRRTPSAS